MPEKCQFGKFTVPKKAPKTEAMILRVFQHPFLRRARILTSGSLVGQGILLLATPVITRLYTPEQFGVLALFLAVVALGMVLVSGRYELALHLPDKDADVFHLLRAIVALVLLNSLLIVFVLWLLPDMLLANIGLTELKPHFWLIAPALIGIGLYTLFTQVGTRFEQERLVAQTRVFQALIGVSFQVLCASLGILALLFGQMMTQSGGVLRLFRQFKKHRAWGTRNGQRGRQLLYRYRKFPLFAMPASLLNRLSFQSLAFFLTATYGASVTGLFLLGQKLVETPMILIGRSFAQVFFAELAARQRRKKQDLHLFYLKTLGFLLGISLPFYLVLYFTAPKLFAWVFGEVWSEAGIYVQVLVPMFWLQFGVMPLFQTLNILERQGLQIVWTGLRFGLVILVFLQAQQMAWDILTLLMMFNWVMFGCYFLHPLLCLWVLRRLRI